MKEKKPISTKGLENTVIKEQKSQMGTVRKTVFQSSLVGLTPLKLANMLKSAKEGNTQAFLSLAEEMEERDVQYRATLNTRKQQVLATSMGVSSVGDSEQQKKIQDFVKKIIYAPVFADMLFSLLDGLGKGYSVVEVNYQEQNGLILPKDYIHHPAEWFKYDTELREVVLLEDKDTTSRLPKLKTIVHKPTLKSGIPIRGALAFGVAPLFILKNYGIKDWAAILEVYGMPIRVGKYGELATEDDIGLLLDAITGIGTDAAAVISKDMEIEFKDGLSNGNTQLFENFITYLDAQISKLVLGQTMTTDSGSSYSQANVHQNTQDYIKKADSLSLAETINQQLIIPLIQYNFGLQEEYPQLFFHLEKEENKLQLVEIVTKIAPFVKGKISMSNLLERLELEEPTGEDDWLDISSLQSINPQQEEQSDKPNKISLNSEDAIDIDVDDELENGNSIITPMIDDIDKLLTNSTSIEDAIEQIETASLNTEKLEKSLFKSSIQEREKIQNKK